MQKCSTKFKLLLISPALFILLQFSLALHHHHSSSYHDNHDYFHTVSTSADKQFVVDTDFFRPFSLQLVYCPLVTSAAHDRAYSQKTFVFTSRSHSRAPPSQVSACNHELSHT